MKNRALILFLLFFPLILLSLWLGELEIRYALSPRVYVAATGYDPRDLLSGHYLSLRPDWNKTDCSQFKENKCPKKAFNYVYRYYLPEAEAKALDKVIFRGGIDLRLEFAYPEKGAPLIRNLLINDQHWKTWTDENLNKE